MSISIPNVSRMWEYLTKVLGKDLSFNNISNKINPATSVYIHQNIKYNSSFRCPDLPQADISQYFDECVEFIDRALSFSCGLVFVNCLLGFSRSTAIVSAYLMKKKGVQVSFILMDLYKCTISLNSFLYIIPIYI